MTIHTVQQGECLSSIAKKYGFADWHTLYDHPQNADFKRKRPNPNLIYPRDKLFIPPKGDKQANGQTEQRHTFKLRAKKTFLRVALYEAGEPLSKKSYKLWVEDKMYEDTTTDDGFVEQEIPASAEQGQLSVWREDDGSGTPYTWKLQIGHLDPVEHITGVQARLNNLGFPCGAVDGICGPKTEAAVKVFQEEYKLTVDGIPGPQTQAKLQEVHGC